MRPDGERVERHALLQRGRALCRLDEAARKVSTSVFPDALRGHLQDPAA